MAISYHVYGNDGQGGPIDYSAPIATVSAAASTPSGSFTAGPLALPSDNLFAVRAFDDVSGVEEANTDARVRLILDAQGNDITARPNAAVGLVARWSVGDIGLVSWGYQTPGQGGFPTRFDVFAGPATADGPPVIPGSPIWSVPATPGVAGYGCRLVGLTSTASYVIRVRAVGATDAAVGPVAATTLAAQSGTLAPVEALRAVATP